MNAQLDQLTARIEPLRQQLTNHPLYSAVRTPGDLDSFMQAHVWAVWDFMSLLKVLQRELTCVTIPWIPVGNAATRYLINEIVIGEESDVDPDGNRTSHFELYLQAMKQARADTRAITGFVRELSAGTSVRDALTGSDLPEGSRRFVNFTFDLIEQGRLHEIAAVFTFGREDLIPDMFMALVQQLRDQAPEQLSLFSYYLERHIEVDGDHHSHLAKAMTIELCGNDPQRWQEAIAAVERALRFRIALWDSVHEQISRKQLFAA
ncbi:DUF3050 domain-containing protein [Spirosoma taeanense]|uniref:DUF3050 domain-containing protein n=1 Tax=Spirosoma taeanense TaxID=2735870 RepID=A0A6M5YBT3_9BACT|nr:DUF3050 domain-containing protein [Spirosoma taeanense]QJW91587.1 DUF3050 domain-containing protein [Spirosoma taeanense]